MLYFNDTFFSLVCFKMMKIHTQPKSAAVFFRKQLALLLCELIFLKKQDEHKSELNKAIFSIHKLKPMYMYLRLVSGRGRRTHHPHDSALNALPLCYSQVLCELTHLQTNFCQTRTQCQHVVVKKICFHFRNNVIGICEIIATTMQRLQVNHFLFRSKKTFRVILFNFHLKVNLKPYFNSKH